MIPEAAVEAATEYLRGRFFWNGPLLDEVARELLEAAAPHMQSSPISAVEIEAASDRERWIVRMAAHVEKLGLQQAVHDYAEGLRVR